jgi:hypothetical protein
MANAGVARPTGTALDIERGSLVDRRRIETIVDERATCGSREVDCLARRVEVGDDPDAAGLAGNANALAVASGNGIEPAAPERGGDCVCGSQGEDPLFSAAVVDSSVPD